MFTLLARLLNDRRSAEELTVDTFHAVWSRAARYDPAAGPVLGWIMNQARSRGIDRLRYEQRKKRTAPPAPQDVAAADESDSTGETIDAMRQGQALRACLSTLAAGEREAIEAAFFLELSYPEVAERLDQPLGTIKTRIRSGLQKLRQAMSAHEERP